MPLHLIKLCVGVSDPAEILDWGRSERPVMHTRMTPRRVEDLTDGGSLYWVIKGLIRVRQPVVEIRTVGAGAHARCEVELGRVAFLTEPQPRRAFQGWRYLKDVEAPRDLSGVAEGDVPGELAAALREIGAW